jgi:AbrB family looped-hinge helix DNA binding protein
LLVACIHREYPYIEQSRGANVMRITSRGQVTIPREIRDALGTVPSSEVEFIREGGRVWLRKRKPGAARGRSLVARMRGRAGTRMSTDEIMALTRGSGA